MVRDIEVVGAAVLHHGRVLATRRRAPAELAGAWELPGGKVEPFEQADAAAVREVREELGCEIAVTGHLAGQVLIRPGYVLRVAVATLLTGEPVPSEHDMIRWLGPEELETVRWLEPDLPFLPALRELLLDGERLEGGNVGGAVRIGNTVRRAAGPWTPAVHAFLFHVAERGLSCVPRVLGTDDRGREVLSFLPGVVVDIATNALSEAQIDSVTRWVRQLHEVQRGFTHPGPWRMHEGSLRDGEIICHKDVAPYNICFQGDQLTGVFDWDMAGPITPLLDLGFLAWNAVPLWRDLTPRTSAARLEAIAKAYAGPTALEILHATVTRVEHLVAGITAGLAAGAEGMLNLAAIGEPEKTAASLADLVRRIPSIERELSEV